MFRVGDKVIRRAEQGSKTQEILWVYNVDPIEHQVKVGDGGHPCGGSWHPESKFVRPHEPQFTPRERLEIRKRSISAYLDTSSPDLGELVRLVRNFDQISPSSNGHYGRTNQDDWHVFGARMLHVLESQGLGDPDIRELCRGLDPETEPPLEPQHLRACDGLAAVCPLCGMTPSVELIRIEGEEGEESQKGLRLTPACPIPKTGVPVVFEIHIPSGRLVVANDLSDFFPTDPAGYPSRSGAMTPYESRQVTIAFAKVGLAHGYVGNSDPRLTADPDAPDRFILGRGPGDDALAVIDTRMWWYSLADEKQLIAHAKHLGENKALKEEAKTVLDVRPGWYEVRHLYGTGMGYHEGDAFATIRWVRPPDPVPDPLWGLRPFMNFKSSAAEMLFDRLLSPREPRLRQGSPWENLSAQDRMTAMHRTAVDLFIARSQWHQDQCVRGVPSPKAVALAKTVGLPPLRGQFYWGQGVHRLLDPKLVPTDAEGGMNADYIGLYANLLRCLISYGFVHLEPPDTRLTFCTPDELDMLGHLRKAVARYRLLLDWHPKVLRDDDEFNEWIRDTKAVTAWIHQLAETSKEAA